MTTARRHVWRPQQQTNKGFVLIVLLALIAMGVLYAVTSALTAVDFKNVRSSATGGLLKQSRDVLLAYALTYPDFPTQNTHQYETVGYLPCPDLDGDGSADALDADCGGTDGKAVIGLLPYKELGLPSNLDADGNCLWYAVSGTFKASTNKPLPMNWDTQGQFEIRDSGDTVLATPNDANGGAAAVVFAVGPFLSGQDRNTISSVSPCGVSVTNKANVVYNKFIDVDPTKTSRVLSEPFPGPANATVRLVQGSADSTVNNDRLVWIAPKEIFDRVRKRSDVATLLDTNLNNVIDDLKSKLTINFSSYSNGTDFALPTALDSYYAGSSLLTAYFKNYSDQFRFRRCATPDDYCFLVDDLPCDGVLLFGGLADGTTNNTTSPRPSDKRTYPYYFESTGNGGLSLFTAGNPTGASPASITNAVQRFSSATPTQDIVRCLKQKVIDSSEMFNASNPALSGNGLVAADGTTLTLGTTSIDWGANAPYYGCLWLPTAIPFGSGIRTYFEYVVTSRSEGFTFTLADADPARNASTTMCGAAADALSYAGNNGTTSPINFPKIALEFDMRRSNPGASGFTRNDPAASPSMHFGIDYWGTTATADDDVTHGAGSGSTAEPTNPAGAPGLRQFSSSVANGTTVFVRLDITRNYSGVTQTGAYDVKAFIIKATQVSWALGTTYFPNSIDCSPGVPLVPGDLKQHLDEDLATRCPSLLTDSSSYLRYLNSSVNIADVGGAGEAMRRVYMGFTVGQNSSQIQTITIGNFQSTTR